MKRMILKLKKTLLKKEIKDENKASENNQKDEISNSLSLSETENRTKKIVTVQEENINGNYGRIYIKENSSNREGDRFDSNTDKLNDKPIQERGKKKIIVLQNNNNKNNNTNNKLGISVNNNGVKSNNFGLSKRTKEKEKEKEKRDNKKNDEKNNYNEENKEIKENGNNKDKDKEINTKNNEV